MLALKQDSLDSLRTGIPVRMMPDHSIEIMGRVDSQVKYRGVRIDTEGISSILRAAAKSIAELDAPTLITSHPQIGQELLVSFVAKSKSKISVMDRRTVVASIWIGEERTHHRSRTVLT